MFENWLGRISKLPAPYLADRIFGFLGRDPALAENDDPVGRDAAGLVAPDVLAPVLQPLHGHLVPGPAVPSLLLPLLTHGQQPDI
jgi:hypothetical protein